MSTTHNQAHNAGPTFLNFQKDGLKLYTGGIDCLVRIWRTDRDGLLTEPAIAHEADEAITGITSAVCFLVISLVYRIDDFSRLVGCRAVLTVMYVNTTLGITRCKLSLLELLVLPYDQSPLTPRVKE
jgi:hypothetical protein